MEWKGAESQDEFSSRSIDYLPLVRKVVKEELLNDQDHVVDIFELDKLDARISELLTAFPEDYITHALAVKAQPLTGVLHHVSSKFARLGFECASLQEALHAKRNTTATSGVIVYDSPVKSHDELTTAIREGFYINVDNVDEMVMIDKILEQTADEVASSSRFGLRVNPLVGAGSVGASSTATVSSKFGLPVCDETFDELVELFRRYPWLQGLHCHIGSQGCSLDLLAAGAKRIFQAAEQINESLGCQQITCIDIGGGMPTSYVTNKDTSFTEYRNSINEVVPELFSGKYRVITEFGRSIFTKNCVTLVRVSSVKRADTDSDSSIDRFRAKNNQNSVMLTFVGSNNFLREAYQMEVGAWRRRFTLFDKDGNIKQCVGTELTLHDIAGPLCFQGDYICKNVPLPDNVSSSDILVIHDTGGYTRSLYSFYNSRPAHAVYGSVHNGTDIEFQIIKKKQSLENVLNFWT